MLLQAGEAALRRVFFCFLWCVFWGSTVWHFFSSMRIYLASYPVCVVMVWHWIVGGDVSVSRLWWCLLIPSKGFSGDIDFVVSHLGE